MQFQLASEVFDGLPAERERELRHALMELNLDGTPEGPTITIARHEDGGIRLELTHDAPLEGAAPSEAAEPGDAPTEVAIPLSRLRRHFREYRSIIGQLTRSGYGFRDMETLDYAKKLAHDDAADTVHRALKGHVVLEHRVARRLFTLFFLVSHDLPASIVTRHGLR